MVFIGKFTNIQLWIWNGFEWNSNEMSCILSTRLRFFEPRVFHRTISFHYSTMYTISRRMYPDSDSWYQWLLLVFLFKWIKCAQMLRTFVNNVCQHQKKRITFWNGFNFNDKCQMNQILCASKWAGLIRLSAFLACANNPTKKIRAASIYILISRVFFQAQIKCRSNTNDNLPLCSRLCNNYLYKVWFAWINHSAKCTPFK